MSEQRATSMPGATASAAARLGRRRGLVAALNVATVVALAVLMAAVFAAGRIHLLEALMWLSFVVTLPWLSVGFWNAVVGLLRGPDPVTDLVDPGTPVTTRTAIAMALRNEAPAVALARLEAMFDDAVAHGLGDAVDVHVLSDTDDPAIAAEEERLVTAWRARSPRPAQVFYRRRATNEGYKAGNLEEFAARCGEDYEFFLPLDADSSMAATLVGTLIRIAEGDPRVGIVQSLAVGTPARSLFTRAFQFGMRHGMRTYTAGSVWWQGDCGPYWGHNALIRIRPFRDHCTLPVLAGTGPLGGHVMSHDQVEAVLMRRAGFDVRVLAQEGGSFEENPPTLPDFIRRELRWCQGNMQYLKLLAMPGLLPVSRVQLALAILMYAGAPAWMAFVGFGAAGVFLPGEAMHPGLGLALFVLVLGLTFAPKLMGLAGVLASQRESRRYGGRIRVLCGGAVEVVVSLMTAPVVAFAVAVFALGLLFGRRIDWRAPPRGYRRVDWDEAAATFAPQTALGVVLTVLFATQAPGVLPWAAPMLAALTLSIPFAVLSAHPAIGAFAMRNGLCAIPEEVPARLTVLSPRPSAA